MKSDVFISYSRKDYKTAKKIYYDLQKAGLVPWMDKIDLVAGQRWELEIKVAIKSSRHFLALLSSNALSEKGYVHKELKLGLDTLDDFPDDKIYLIPVRIDDCAPKDEKLKGLHWTDLYPSYENGLNDILRALEKNPLKNTHNRSFIIKLVILTMLIITVPIFYLIFEGNKSDINNKHTTSSKHDIFNRKIDIYQFGSLNYNKNILKYLLLAINDFQQSYAFRLHDPKNLDDELVKNKAENNKNLLFHLSKNYEEDKEFEDNPVIGLVSFPLFSNAFSFSSSSYTIITTYDWNLREFQNPTIYEYIIHSLMVCSLLTTHKNPNKIYTDKDGNFVYQKPCIDRIHHEPGSISYRQRGLCYNAPVKNFIGVHEIGVTHGCIFDYNYEKLAIKNLIRNSKICNQHRIQLVENFGEYFILDIERILSFSWLKNDKILKDIERLYGYRFFE